MGFEKKSVQRKESAGPANFSGNKAIQKKSAVGVVQKVNPDEMQQHKSDGTVQKVEPPMEEPAPFGVSLINTPATNPAHVAPAQRKENKTGMPDNLKSGIENLSGMSMDHVKVHYNSSQPAQLNALAYAQGSDIHVGPGQEKHLPHEAWHVVQQAQGRVQPTTQMKAGVAVNDDPGLEHEADVMGERAMSMGQGVLQGFGLAQMKSKGMTVQFWNPRTVHGILKADDEAKEKVLPELNSLNIFSKFTDATYFGEDQDGLAGITFSKQKQIYINDGLSNKEAASTIFHEFHHTMHTTQDVSTEKNRKKKDKEDLKNEIDTWKREYAFKIRQGLITDDDVQSGLVNVVELKGGTKSYTLNEKTIKETVLGGYDDDYKSGRRTDRFNPANWVFNGPSNLLTWNWNG